MALDKNASENGVSLSRLLHIFAGNIDGMDQDRTAPTLNHIV